MLTEEDMTKHNIRQKLLRGEILGNRGALGDAYEYLIDKAHKGDISYMSLIANVFYTTSATYYSSKGVLSKLRALLYLFAATKWINKAFMQFGYVHTSLFRAIEYYDVVVKKAPYVKHEVTLKDLHILMACHIQMIHVKRRMHILSISFHEKVIASCLQVFQRHEEEEYGLYMLAIADSSSVSKDADDRDKKEEQVRKYLFGTKHHPGGMFQKLIESDSPQQENPWEAQVVCRLLRKMRKNKEALQIAEKYMLYGQKNMCV
jgi:hypothetical protein